MSEPADVQELLRAVEGFRFVARVTDVLLDAGEMPVKLGRVLAATIEDMADWAAIYVAEPPTTIRLAEVLHRDPQKTGLLEEARGQRIFNRDSERGFYDTLMKHRSMLRTNTGIDRLRETLQLYLLPIFMQVTPRSMLTVPLFTPDRLYGALTIYSQSRNFTSADHELLQEVARRIALLYEHEESLERERRLTRTLQEVTLPAQLPKVPGATVSTVYVPATTTDAQVGGDWYDIFALPNGRFLFSIGDVTGRGLHASAIMGKLRHSINVIGMYESDPVKILDAAERVLQQRYPDAIATSFVAIYDPATHSVRAANAGHPFPVLRMHDGSLEELVAEGMPIGLRTFAPPSPSVSRRLDGVGAIIFHTDGVVEANREFTMGARNLERAMSNGALPFVQKPAALIAASCLSPLAADDAAILVVAFPTTAWSFQAEHALAATDARSDFVSQLREEGVREAELFAAESIFGELVANVVRHAPGPIDIALEWVNDVAVLHVTDRGGGFRFKQGRRADVMMETGRGLWLMEEFGGSVAVERIPGYGTHVRVELPVRRGEQAPRTERARALA